jgi:hypothetical protein
MCIFAPRCPVLRDAGRAGAHGGWGHGEPRAGAGGSCVWTTCDEHSRLLAEVVHTAGTVFSGTELQAAALWALQGFKRSRHIEDQARLIAADARLAVRNRPVIHTPSIIHRDGAGPPKAEREPHPHPHPHPASIIHDQEPPCSVLGVWVVVGTVHGANGQPHNHAPRPRPIQAQPTRPTQLKQEGAFGQWG